MGDDFIQFIFSPILYFNLIEWRNSTISSEQEDGKMEFTENSFPVLGSWGFNLETGLFFPKIHTGLKLGFDWSYFNDFKLEQDIEYKTYVFDRELGVTKQKSMFINKLQVSSYLFYIDFFVLF